MGRISFLVVLALFCQSCVSGLQAPWLSRQNTELPAAAYFQWVESATTVQRQQEWDRLQVQVSIAPDVVALVQRAIVIYYQGDNGQAIADLNLSSPMIPSCGQSPRCQDYTSFAALFREMAELELQLQTRQAETRALQDRIRVLDQQIEALTNIEQQLLERDQRPD